MFKAFLVQVATSATGSALSSTGYYGEYCVFLCLGGCCGCIRYRQLSSFSRRLRCCRFDSSSNSGGSGGPGGVSLTWWLRHFVSGGLLVHFLLDSIVGKRGHLLGNATPCLRGCACLKGQYWFEEREGGWAFKNIFSLGMILAQDFMIGCRKGRGVNEPTPLPPLFSHQRELPSIP